MFPEPSYPTPVRACPELGGERAELWLKNDGLSHAIYGGNKVRKAIVLLEEARRRSARRVLSFGAAGSHHLLTLALFAQNAGLDSAAVMIPQPHTPHAERTLRAALGLGLEAHPASEPALVPWAFARAWRPGDYVVPPGGSNVLGARACADAIDELAEQIALGQLPMPDCIVVPLGSGGTCGGLAAGVARRGLPCRVLGVQVVPGFAPRVAARFLARAALGRNGTARDTLATRLMFDTTQIGAGYGFATSAGERATEIAKRSGLELDPTYTAKAFASVLELLHGDTPFIPRPAGRALRILYWHTLAATALEPLLVDAPRASDIPRTISSLLR